MKNYSLETIRRFVLNATIFARATGNLQSLPPAGEDRRKHFYGCQLDILEALGIPVDGGYASEILKAARPSMGVTAAVWVLQHTLALMKWGTSSSAGALDAINLVLRGALNTVNGEDKASRLYPLGELWAAICPDKEEIQLPEAEYLTHFVPGIAKALSILGNSTTAEVREHLRFLVPIVEQMDSCQRNSVFRSPRIDFEQRWIRENLYRLQQRGLSERQAGNFLAWLISGGLDYIKQSGFGSHKHTKTRLQSIFFQLGLVGVEEPGSIVYWEIMESIYGALVVEAY